MEPQRCESCGMTVIAGADGTCPSCGHVVGTPVPEEEKTRRKKAVTAKGIGGMLVLLGCVYLPIAHLTGSQLASREARLGAYSVPLIFFLIGGILLLAGRKRR